MLENLDTGMKDYKNLDNFKSHCILRVTKLYWYFIGRYSNHKLYYFL